MDMTRKKEGRTMPHVIVKLWPGKAPDEPAPIGAEIVRMSPRLDRKQVEVTEPTRLVTNVSEPTRDSC